MSYLTIDGYTLQKFIIAGANRLIENKGSVDALNVFPVPDGDTGTNMSLTVASAAKEVMKLNTPVIADVAKAAASGSLRGARGNSGVILSQLFRGFAKGLEGKETANVVDIALSFDKARQTAYKAVMKPKEGTILTVAREVSEKAIELSYAEENLDVFLEKLIEYANEVLLKTTDMLPQLKQAGVVDAGGKGFIHILEGGLENRGAEVTLNDASSSSQGTVMADYQTEEVDIKFGYCTEFFINVDNANEETVNNLKDYLMTIGDSIVAVHDSEIIKIHVHTNNPGKVLERALKIGSLSNIKIENMRIQHTNNINFTKQAQQEVPVEEQEEKEIGFVSVCVGSGIKEIFKNLGADYIIEGGQTMNPSTEDILQAVEKVNAKNVFVLPNNKNIILAAEQAAKLCKDKNIIVIGSTTIPQGISALVNFMPTDSVEDNAESINEGLEAVSTLQVTYAVRDTEIDDKKIVEGDILCMSESGIDFVEKDLQEGTKKLISNFLDNNIDKSFITIFYGEDATEDKANELADYVAENYPDIEVEVQSGNQPVYYYIISVE